MARETKVVKVPHFEACRNRDLGKQYFIQEWPAATADKWIQRLAFSFNKDGGQLPLNMRGVGWEGIAIVGINTFLRGNGDREEMMRLADELLDCVQIIRDPKYPQNPSPIVADEDVEEVATRYWLRDQVVSVHTGFSPGAALWRLLSSITEKAPDSENTKTSPPTSG